MPVLTPGVATRSRTPTLLVENRLPAGTVRFQLTVVDDAGNESDPVILAVQLRAPPLSPTGGVPLSPILFPR